MQNADADVLAVLGDLVGLECRAAANPYGSILTLDFGELGLPPDPLPNEHPRGFRSLTIFSPWRLEDRREIVADWNVDGGASGLIDPLIQGLVGVRIFEAHSRGPGWDLVLTWGNGLALRVFGDINNSREKAWMILGTDGVVVSARPVVRPLSAGRDPVSPRFQEQSSRPLTGDTIERIEEAVASLAGLECTGVQNPYGSILSIDLGERRIGPGSPPRTRPHGFRHLTVYSPWRLETEHEVLLDWNVDGGPGSLLARNIQDLVGQTVLSADTSPPGWDLTITWSGGFRLVIFGDADDARDTAWFITGWDGLEVSACPILRPLPGV